MKWGREFLFLLRNAFAVYLILWSASLMWFSFRKVENPMAYQEFLEHVAKASGGGLLFHEAQRDFLYLTLPLFSISLALGLRLYKLRA
jgi:hypothetical protein